MVQAQENSGTGQLQGKNMDNEVVYSYIVPTEECYTNAKKLADNRYQDRETGESLYAELSYRVQFLENTRRGFFCVICSVKGQKNIFTTWRVFNWFYNRRVYYDKEFCNDIVAHTEPITYHLYKDYSEFLR